MRRMSAPTKEPYFSSKRDNQPTLPDFDNLPPIMEPDRRPHPMDGLSPGDIIARAAQIVPENINPDSAKNKALPDGMFETAPPKTAPAAPMARARRRPADRAKARVFRTARTLRYAPLLILALAGPVYLWTSGAYKPLLETAEAALGSTKNSIRSALKLHLAEVLVTGRRRTTPQALRRALATGRGADILELDLVAMRSRIEQLPWIKTADVERRLPGTLYLRLTERTPVARLLAASGQALIGSEGAVIPVTPGKAYEHLPLLAGRGAPSAAPALLRMLAGNRLIGRRVIAARRHGDRRWDLLFDNGVVVNLPEHFEAEAWARFIMVQRRERLIDRGVIRVDLRLPDRLIIQRKPAPKPVPKAATSETKGPDRAPAKVKPNGARSDKSRRRQNRTG